MSRAWFWSLFWIGENASCDGGAITFSMTTSSCHSTMNLDPGFRPISLRTDSGITTCPRVLALELASLKGSEVGRSQIGIELLQQPLARLLEPCYEGAACRDSRSAIDPCRRDPLEVDGKGESCWETMPAW